MKAVVAGKLLFLFLLNPKTLNRYTGLTKEKCIALRVVIKRIPCTRWLLVTKIIKCCSGFAPDKKSSCHSLLSSVLFPLGQAPRGLCALLVFILRKILQIPYGWTGYYDH